MKIKISRYLLIFAFISMPTLSLELKSDETDAANDAPFILTSEEFIKLAKDSGLSYPVVGKAYEALQAIIQERTKTRILFGKVLNHYNFCSVILLTLLILLKYPQIANFLALIKKRI